MCQLSLHSSVPSLIDEEGAAGGSGQRPDLRGRNDIRED